MIFHLHRGSLILPSTHGERVILPSTQEEGDSSIYTGGEGDYSIDTEGEGFFHDTGGEGAFSIYTGGMVILPSTQGEKVIIPIFSGSNKMEGCAFNYNGILVAFWKETSFVIHIIHYIGYTVGHIGGYTMLLDVFNYVQL